MRYAHFFNVETGAVHRIPRKKFEEIQNKTKEKVLAGVDSDTASNEMHEYLCGFMEKKKRHKWEVQGHRWLHIKVCVNCGCTKNTSILNHTVYNKAGVEYFTSPNCE